MSKEHINFEVIRSKAGCTSARWVGLHALEARLLGLEGHEGTHTASLACIHPGAPNSLLYHHALLSHVVLAIDARGHALLDLRVAVHAAGWWCQGKQINIQHDLLELALPARYAECMLTKDWHEHV